VSGDRRNALGQSRGWAILLGSINKRSIREIDPQLIGGFGGLLKQAGVHLRESSDGTLRIRAGQTHPVFFRLTALQNSAGHFLPDAQRRVERSGANLEMDRAIREHAKVQGLETTTWGKHELRLATQAETVEALKDIRTSVGAPTFFRIESTRSLMARLFLWDVLTELSRGTPSGEVIERLRGRKDRLVTGLVQVAPGSFICPPLMARAQPLAVLFTTAHLSQLVALAPTNAFVRPIDFVTWPVGLSRIRFGGAGHNIYTNTVDAFPDGHAERLLRILTRQSGNSIHHLTQPERHATTEGLLDVDEFWLTWSSVLLGMDAIAGLASEWDRAEAIWTAFRALGILQGIWLGDRRDGVPLSKLLDPAVVQEFAVSSFPRGPERDWATGVMNNYQEDLRSRFRGLSTDEALREVADLRNLLHGVRSTGDRTRRLRVLSRIDQNAPNLQLINEVATYWWTAAILRPETILRSGTAPWE